MKPVWIGLLVVATALVAGPATAGEEVRGFATVKSGNNLIVGKRAVRLFGVRAPKLDAICEVNGAKMKCGVVAWAELVRMADGWHVSCDIEVTVKNGPDYATCYVSERDINEALVRAGWAKAVKRQTDRYVVDEDDAKQSKRGLWNDGKYPKR